MEAIERRHKKMYFISQALLIYDRDLTKDESFWAQKGRTVLNITPQEAKIFSEVL